MPDQTRTDGATGAATAVRPSLLRSIVHRLAGDEVALPIEGELASFGGATGWLNSPPLTPESLRGRVVLVDVWTYTCINWLRTLPYVRAWAAKYADAGLTVVGIHTPEFGFERDVDNITVRAREFGVEYPIAIDSDYGVWRAFDNHYWPAAYLADAEGRIRFHHFGEGEYAATEMAIQALLAEAGAAGIDEDLVMVEPHGLEVAADWRTLRTPETYLGYRQATGFAQEETARFGERATFGPPASLPLNAWGLTGAWTVASHASVSHEAGAKIAFRFQARDVNLVMGPVGIDKAIPFRVYLDGEPAVDAAGTDVDGEARGTLDAQRTYQLIRQAGPVAERTFEIQFEGPGAEAYCFTFG
jgi:thiol-disulfide isomerase/thioredoxin